VLPRLVARLLGLDRLRLGAGQALLQQLHLLARLLTDTCLGAARRDLGRGGLILQLGGALLGRPEAVLRVGQRTLQGDGAPLSLLGTPAGLLDRRLRLLDRPLL